MATAVVGKLYLANAHSSANIGQTARLELKGTVNLTIYGSEEAEEVLINVSNMTPVSEILNEDFYYPLDTLPKYVAFIGTADRINVGGYDLTEIKDIS
jgi:hypothetical protein